MLCLQCSALPLPLFSCTNGPPTSSANDVSYADTAQSLLHHGFYGVHGTPETTQPLGLSLILSALFGLFGYSFPIAVGAMAVFETLGFLASYEWLRRRVPRFVAATICIILLSSPLYFAWPTRMVYACFAYFFTTRAALLSADEYEKATGLRSCVIWGTVSQPLYVNSGWVMEMATFK